MSRDTHPSKFQLPTGDRLMPQLHAGDRTYNTHYLVVCGMCGRCEPPPARPDRGVLVAATDAPHDILHCTECGKPLMLVECITRGECRKVPGQFLLQHVATWDSLPEAA